MIKKILAAFAVVIILLVSLVFFRKDLTLKKEVVKEKYRQPNSTFIDWNGCQLHYTESGKGFPILMIHGFGGSHCDFMLLDSLLNDKYRVIRIDMPGFGLSDFPKSTTKEQDYIKIYDDYFSFIIDTLHLDSMYVMGNSLGGMMSWNLTLHHPGNVKKLVLFNSAGYDMKEAVQATNAEMFKKKYVQLFMERGIPVYLTSRGMSRIFYDKSRMTDEMMTRVNDLWNREGNLKHIMNMVASEKYLNTDVIKNISCPTLVIWGKQDEILPVKYADNFRQDIKNSRLIIYDKCGHVPMVENALQVQHDVLEFLNEN